MSRFRFNAEKAMAYISERVRLEGQVDIHSLFGTLYLADKDHFVDWGRPVFGGDYVAEKIGPVHVQVRAMLMGDPVYLCEANMQDYAWIRDGRHLFFKEGVKYPDPLLALSGSDISAIRAARGVAYESLVSNPLRDSRIHDGAWSRARGGIISYADIAKDAGYDFSEAEIADFWHKRV